jgi:rhamnosyltransferase
VPFREVPYAEDRVLAIDMLRAGYGKAFVPEAGVIHSHDYKTFEELRRCFDEWRGLREVYGWRESASPRRVAGKLRGELGAARRELIDSAASSVDERATLLHRCTESAWRGATLATLARHHVVRLTGALLGSRAEALPSWARRRLSLEGRGGFQPLDLDGPREPLSTQDGRT